MWVDPISAGNLAVFDCAVVNRQQREKDGQGAQTMPQPKHHGECQRSEQHNLEEVANTGREQADGQPSRSALEAMATSQSEIAPNSKDDG